MNKIIEYCDFIIDTLNKSNSIPNNYISGWITYLLAKLYSIDISIITVQQKTYLHTQR